jgi:hypothetical protein
MSRPGSRIDPAEVARLRDKLDRFAQLPPPPVGGPGPPGCPICAGLAQQISRLDQTGHELQMQSEAIVKDLSLDGGKGVRAAKVPIVKDLTQQLDEYFALRAQLVKRYDQALGKTKAR